MAEPHMCGIIAVLSRPDDRCAPDPAACAARVAEAADRIRAWGTADESDGALSLAEAVAVCQEVVHGFRGLAGIRALLGRGDGGLQGAVGRLGEAIGRFEKLAGRWPSTGRQSVWIHTLSFCT